MNSALLTPCADWVERLVMRNHDDLSYADRVALHEHLALCSACATAHANYQLIGNHLFQLTAVAPLEKHPYVIRQQAQRTPSRQASIAIVCSGILRRLQSLLVAFIFSLQKANYASDTHYCYALQESSGFLRWKYKKSEVFFSAPAIKNGIAYATPFDSTLFLFAAQVKPSGSSFLWKC